MKGKEECSQENRNQKELTFGVNVNSRGLIFKCVDSSAVTTSIVPAFLTKGRKGMNTTRRENGDVFVFEDFANDDWIGQCKN